MGSENEKKAISAEKLTANRANAQRSTGPQTPRGKKRSSQNARRHGFFAKRLFGAGEDQAEDRTEYELIREGVFDHYQPVGFMEGLWAEKIAAEELRSLRVFEYEQDVLGSPLNVLGSPFESAAIDRVLRHQAATSRQLSQAIERLKQMQAVRKAQEKEDPPLVNFERAPAEDLTEERSSSREAIQEDVDPQDLSSRNCGTNPTGSSEMNDSIEASASD